MEAGAGRAAGAGGASHEGSILSAACQHLAPLFGGCFYQKKVVKASHGMLGQAAQLPVRPEAARPERAVGTPARI